MKNLVFISLCLVAIVLARPEPDVSALKNHHSHAQSYSYSNGLNINHHSDNTAALHGQQSHGYSHGYTGHGNFDAGLTGPSAHAHSLTIQPSQSIEIPSGAAQQNHHHQHNYHHEQVQHQDHHSYVEQQHNAGIDIGHRTYGIQQEEQQQHHHHHQQQQHELQEHHHNHIEAEISPNAGEGIIEPRLNLETPSNSYIPPSVTIAPPLPAQNTYIPPAVGTFQSNEVASTYYAPAIRPIVHKHVYVHVPPRDFEDEPRPRQLFPVQQAQKHYKIIFIKAPAPPTYQPPVIPIQPQNEEKTLIYVLHRKPEEPKDIIIPTPIPTQPTKPEVYFIKYKTRKDSNVSGLYGAPAAAPIDTTSAAGFVGGEEFSSAAGTGPEHAAVAEAEQHHHHEQQNENAASHDDNNNVSQGYLPPHKF